MQGVMATSVRQSFALPKCSASKENKSRIRRTKEERKTMVASFIKKYQNSNNGKFPSLNLAHKEVGGSFYTIREIVREIIQENKVLGPGNPSSKSLNLEYYSEEDAGKGFFLDAHHEVDSSMVQHEVSGEDHTEIIESGGQLLFKTDIIENFSWQVKNGEASFKEDSDSGIVLCKKLANTTEEDASGSDENAEFQSNNLVDINILYDRQSISVYPSFSGTGLVESESSNEDTENKISAITHCFEESSNISVTAVADGVPGISMHSTDVVDDQSSDCNVKYDIHGVSPFADYMVDRYGLLEAGVQTVVDISPSEPLVKGAVICTSELETEGSNNRFSSLKISSAANKDDTSLLPLYKEAEPRNIALFSERGVDAAEGKSVDNFVLQRISSPKPQAVENDTQLADKSSSFVGAVKEIENASNELLKAIIQDANNHSDLKAENQSDTSSPLDSEGFMSSSNGGEATKEPGIAESETNTIWSAIKAFVSSFIKFWAE